LRRIVLVTVFASLLLVGAISNQSFGATGHSYVLDWGGFGFSYEGQFFKPQNLATDDEQNIYVTDSGNSRVQKFTSDGKFLLSWGTNGKEDGQFLFPTGIATFENFVYVVDSEQFTVQKFDRDGNFILKWGEFGYKPGQFNFAKGITVDSNGIVYVADTVNHRIQQFTTDGEFISSFGKYGFVDGGLKTPIDIAVNENFIYVSDPGNNKIEKYTSDGIYLKTFDQSFGGKSITPKGLDMDPDGNIYLVDSANQRILKIDSEGNTMAIWGTLGNDKGEFLQPNDLVLDNLGYLFVIDSAYSKIQKFQTPFVLKIQEALAAEQAKKLEELAYSETEYNEQEVETSEEISVHEEPTVIDTVKPTLFLPDDLVIEASGTLTSVDVGDATATDDNGIQLIVNNSPGMFPLGSSAVVWTAVDNAGNSVFATQHVNVVDTTSPSISSLSDIIAEAVVPLNNIIELQSPEAHDIIGAVSITNNAPEFFPIGETIVTWIATDESENTVSIEHKVTIIDTISPTLIVPEDIIVEATSSDQNEVQLGESVATDNGEIISITNNAPEFFALGDTTVIWTVSDYSGNISTGNQLVTVTDTTTPEISQLEDIIAEATSVNENIVNLDEPSTFDIQELIIYKNAPDVFPIGDTLVTWIITDETGNHSVATQIVTIVDTTVPTLTVPEDLTVEAVSLQETLVEIGQAGADDISGISSIVNNAPDVFPLGSTIVTWSATDNNHNTISAEQTITVVDTTTPTIVTPQNIVSEAVNPTLNFIHLGELDASDSVDIESISNDKPIIFPFGDTTVIWTVTDTSGNISQAVQVVTIIDTTAPDVSPPSDIITEATDLSNNVVELGEATAYDIMSIESITNDAPEFFSVGETTITWTATDSSGNSSTVTQTVTIIDTITPSITAPDSITVEATSADFNVVELGEAIYDDLVDISSITNDAPEFFPVGETTITWTTTDSSGNSSTATQFVTIIDTTAPVLTVPENVAIVAFSLEKEVDIGTALTTDLVDSMPTLTNNAPEIFPLGDTIVTWNVSDEFGNSASYEQVISVQPCGESLSYYNQILGTFEDDIITGTQFADLIFAFGGNDIISGGQGNDCIIGGGGDDFIFGNAGNDHLVGGEGNDILKGYSGEDKLTGGLGFDVLDGGDDFDVSYDSVSDIVIACEEEL
jgi:hypothetical protein